MDSAIRVIVKSCIRHLVKYVSSFRGSTVACYRGQVMTLIFLFQLQTHQHTSRPSNRARPFYGPFSSPEGMVYLRLVSIDLRYYFERCFRLNTPNASNQRPPHEF